MDERPEPESIAPHDGYGGGMPKPRNDSAASARITWPRPMVARMRMVAITFGRTYRITMRRCPAPSARAASMYGLAITDSAAPRMTREAPAAPRIDRARTRLKDRKSVV